MKLFPTSLETYRQCPRKFSYDRNPEIKARYRKPSQAMFVGTCVHDALERFFDPNLTPVPKRDYETLVQHLRDAWSGKHLHGKRLVQRREERRAVFGADRATEGAAGEKAKHLLFRFVQTQDIKVVPFTTEQFHEIPLGGKHVLAGKVDRVDRMPDGSLKVIDYKTGKGKSAAMAKAEDLQLAAYSLIVGRKYKVPVTRCALLFLAEDQEVGWEPDAAWLAAKEAELLELFDSVEREENASDGPERFLATPNNLCGWCDYLELCPPGQAKIGADRAAEDQMAGPGEEPPF